MEDFEFDPNFGWTPEDSLEMAWGEDILKLHWGDTTVYKYTVGEGRYDHVEHVAESGERYQFFLEDDPEIRDSLERHGYPYTLDPLVEPGLVEARAQHDIDLATNEFAAELEELSGLPEDLS